MSTESNLTSVISVLPVAEWQLAENAWIQVSADPESAGQTTVVLGVADIDVQRAACETAGVPWGDVNDYGFVKTAEAADPAGNKIVFVQDLSDARDDETADSIV